jgi:hypothetical protein
MSSSPSFTIPKKRRGALQPEPETAAIVVTAVIAEETPLRPDVTTANDDDEDLEFVRASRFCVSLR